MVTQSRYERKYKVEKYLRQIKGEERKEANLNIVASAYIKQEELASRPNTVHRERQDRGHDKHN